ncbi:MAG: hypothetical protein ACK4MV_00020 [Beijerinckiaceae bacterium]
MDQSSEHGGPQSVPDSWGAWVSRYGFTLAFVAPLYLAAGAGGEAIGTAILGEQGLLNLFPAALAMYILHRCFWD